MTKLIWVQSGKNDGRVALFEQDERHPNGEAFVAETPVQVAITLLVERKLVSGELVKVDEPKKVEEKPIHKSREEVQAEIERARAGTGLEEFASPIQRGVRPERKKPGRPRKES
jgi:hypothetical protein